MQHMVEILTKLGELRAFRELSGQVKPRWSTQVQPVAAVCSHNLEKEDANTSSLKNAVETR